MSMSVVLDDELDLVLVEEEVDDALVAVIYERSVDLPANMWESWHPQ